MICRSSSLRDQQTARRTSRWEGGLKAVRFPATRQAKKDAAASGKRFAAMAGSATALVVLVLNVLGRYGRRFLAHAEEWRVEPEERRLRIFASTVVVLICAAAVSARLYHIVSVEEERWTALANKQHQGMLAINGARGTVLDAMGRTLAQSVEGIAVGLHHRAIKDPALVAERLAPVIGIDSAEILASLKKKGPFTKIAKDLPPALEERIAALQLKGVSTFKEFRRVYPQGELAGSLLGRVGYNNRGQSGIELTFDAELSAPNVNLAVRRDARGKLFTPVGWESGGANSVIQASLFSPIETLLSLGSKPLGPEMPQHLRREGGALTLSIDSVVQSIVEEEFELAQRETGAKQVYGLVLDADTGEIVALAQYPRTLDPNRSENVDPSDLRSPVIQDGFEPGSTMKPLVAAAAIDAGIANINESIDCENGSYSVGGRIIRDVHPSAVLSLREVLVRSSNICIAKVGERMGKARLHSALAGFGFGKETNVEIAGEARGILRSHSNWAEIDVATAAFGQGVAVTAIQLARAYAALANGGYLVSPTILLRSAPAPRPRLIQESSAADVRTALLGVTEEDGGTGKLAKIQGVPVYGKTGTAQKARTDGRGYEPDKMLSSFVGFVRGGESFVNRTLVMAVFVDEPKTTVKYGGVLAAPVFRRAMSRTISYLMSIEGIATQRAQLNTQPSPRGYSGDNSAKNPVELIGVDGIS